MHVGPDTIEETAALGAAAAAVDDMGLLPYEGDAELPALVLDVLAIVTGNRDCVADIAEAQALPFLFAVTQTLPTCASA